MPNTQEYYVAFSIHGSYCFITANIVTDKAQISGQKVVIDGFSFTKGQSRDGSSKRNAQKLLSPELRGGNNQPLTNARDIHAYFIKLRENGWTVDDAAFIKKHKLTPVKIPVAKPVETETPKPEAKTDFSPETPSVRTQDESEKLTASNETAGAVVTGDKGPTQIEDLPAPEGDNPAQPEPNPAAYDPNVENKNTDYARYREPETKAEEKPAFENLDGTVKAIQGDITKFSADGIVNAANAQMRVGGGVDGAINRAAGPDLGKEMEKTGGCQTGYAVVTDAFDLNKNGVRHIIHAVGPIYRDYKPDESAQLLRSAYDSAFSLARVHGCKTMGVPLLSTGVYGYPMAEACKIAVQAARAFNTGDGGLPLDITFVAFDDAAFAAIQDALSTPSHE